MTSIQQSFNQMLSSVARAKIGHKVISKVADFDVAKANKKLQEMKVEEAAAQQEAADIESQTKGFESASEQYEFENIVNKSQPVTEEPSAFGESLKKRYLELEGHKTGIEERKEILRKYGSPYVIGTGEGR